MEEVTIEEVIESYKHSTTSDTLEMFKICWILPDNYDIKQNAKEQSEEVYEQILIALRA